MTTADLILDILAAHGVRDVFGMPGDADRNEGWIVDPALVERESELRVD